MTEINPVSGKLSDALNEITCPAFTVRAMLQGAMSLLDEAEHLDNRSGDIWAARELVSAAWEKVAEIYGDNQCLLLDRLTAIDEAGKAEVAA